MSGFCNPAFASLRYGFAVLALLALSALLVRPVCDALEPLSAAKGAQLERLAAAQDHHDSEPCCDALSADGTLLAAPALSSVAPEHAGPALAVPVLQKRQAFAHAAVDPPRLPPRSLRYHARTARILV